MPTKACPECGHYLAHSVGTTVVGGQALYRFVCPECQYEWTEAIL